MFSWPSFAWRTNSSFRNRQCAARKCVVIILPPILVFVPESACMPWARRLWWKNKKILIFIVSDYKICRDLKRQITNSELFTERTVLRLWTRVLIIWASVAMPTCSTLQYYFLTKSRLFLSLQRTSSLKTKTLACITNRLRLNKRSRALINERERRNFNQNLAEKVFFWTVWSIRMHSFGKNVRAWFVNFQL